MNDIKVIGVYANSAFSGWEFSTDGVDMFARYVYDGHIDSWELISDDKISVDDTGAVVFSVSNGAVQIPAADILRV